MQLQPRTFNAHIKTHHGFNLGEALVTIWHVRATNTFQMVSKDHTSDFVIEDDFNSIQYRAMAWPSQEAKDSGAFGMPLASEADMIEEEPQPVDTSEGRVELIKRTFTRGVTAELEVDMDNPGIKLIINSTELEAKEKALRAIMLDIRNKNK